MDRRYRFPRITITHRTNCGRGQWVTLWRFWIEPRFSRRTRRDIRVKPLFDRRHLVAPLSCGHPQATGSSQWGGTGCTQCRSSGAVAAFQHRLGSTGNPASGGTGCPILFRRSGFHIREHHLHSTAPPHATSLDHQRKGFAGLAIGILGHAVEHRIGGDKQQAIGTLFARF